MDERADQDLMLQSELLKCLKAAVNHKRGIEAMTDDPALVPALCLSLSSEDVFVATQVLELLAVIMVDGREGHRAILDAMDYFKLVKVGHDAIDGTLVAALRSEHSLPVTTHQHPITPLTRGNQLNRLPSPP